MNHAIKYLLIAAITLSFGWSCQKSKSRVLYVFNWTDYIAPELIKQFETEYDCRVVYDMYNSNENMLTKVLTAQAMYDIIVPTGDHLEILRDKGLLMPIDKTRLKNYANLEPAILTKAAQFDTANTYGIPYFWGTSGFIYNKKYVSEEKMKDASWDFIRDTLFRGNNVVSMLDDEREVVGAALIYSGYTPNSLEDSCLAKAEQILMEWDKTISHYDSDSYKNEIQDGTVWMAHSYNGDALQIMAVNQDIGFTLPREGATLWIDFMVIPVKSENQELAYQFIDFLLGAEQAKQNALYVQYATPNREAVSLLPESIRSNPYIYPDSAYLDKCHLIQNIGEDVLKIDNIWQKIRNN
ncbi:MAG: spermidine/putrescine ABC transporter substrate-binding protein [Candidatus Delongbacteria bacterium]|nr:spermidine/putrescine ABC transporter substrate-binding protein [Candidatus Delongbacteria bacterium]